MTKVGVPKVWQIWQNCIFRQILFIQSLIFPDISGKFAKLYPIKLIVMQFCQPIATPNFRRVLKFKKEVGIDYIKSLKS